MESIGSLSKLFPQLIVFFLSLLFPTQFYIPLLIKVNKSISASGKFS
mgnify:CR=1 FL=1